MAARLRSRLRRMFNAAAVLVLAALGLIAVPGATQAAGSLPCDIYGAAGTSCVAAYSTVRALYSAYDGPLYQVRRVSDGATTDVGLLAITLTERALRAGAEVRRGFDGGRLDAGARTDALGVERFSRRMRGRIGGDNFYGVAAVGQEAGVERIGFVGQIVFEQEPAGVAVSAVIDGVDELIVILVVRGPLHSDGIAVV